MDGVRANAYADQRVQCMAQLACSCDSGPRERMDNMQDYRRLPGYQPQSSVSLLAAQCVPAGSCSGPCCGSAWSSLRPRWCRTVHTAYSRSRSVARWTPRLLVGRRDRRMRLMRAHGVTVTVREVILQTGWVTMLHMSQFEVTMKIHSIIPCF